MTADHATALREAVNVIMHYQFTHTRDAMHALQTLVDAAEAAAYEIDLLRSTLVLQQRSYEREIVLEVEGAQRCRNRPCAGTGEQMSEGTIPAQGSVDGVVGRRVLDPCCGGRMMWLNKQNPDVVFGDRRSETLTVTDRSHGNKSGTRTLRIEPDTLMDFRALPFNDGTFRLVAFDPPHLVRAGPRSWLAAKYGKLGQDWRDDLRQGFAECFRVLHPDGVLVFKWAETQVKLSEVLALVPHAPLFGNTSGKKAGTHWLVFMKPNV